MRVRLPPNGAEPKDELYTGMRAGSSPAPARLSASQRTLQSMLEGMARGVDKVMREHPNWMPLLGRDQRLPQSVLSLVDTLAELMQQQGFLPADVLRAYGCVMSFAVGSRAGRARPRRRRRHGCAALCSRQRARDARAGRFTNLATATATLNRWRSEDLFELGLRSLLAGIESRSAGKASP